MSSGEIVAELQRAGCPNRTAWWYVGKVRKRAAALQLNITSDEWRVECSRMLERAYEVGRNGTTTTFPDGTTKHSPHGMTMVNAAARLAELHGANRPVHIVVEQARHTTAREIAERMSRELDAETFAKVLAVIERAELPGEVVASVVEVRG